MVWSPPSGPLSESQHSLDVADLSPRVPNGRRKSQEASGHQSSGCQGSQTGQGNFDGEEACWMMSAKWMEEWLGWGSGHRSELSHVPA